MKILNCISGKLIMVAIACSFAASTTIQAQEVRSNSALGRSEDDAHLVVDGVHVANLGLSQSYDAVLPRGQHVLSVSTSPQAYRYTPPTQRRVNAEPGKTYAFTAFWQNYDEAYLEKNGASQRIVTPSNPG